MGGGRFASDELRSLGSLILVTEIQSESVLNSAPVYLSFICLSCSHAG